MKIYIVMDQFSQDEVDARGVFSTIKNARAFIDKYRFYDPFIIEYTLDSMEEPWTAEYKKEVKRP